MMLGAATHGRGSYTAYNASVLFLEGFLTHKQIKTFTFAAWCTLPIKVSSFLSFFALLFNNHSYPLAHIFLLS